MMKVLVLEDDPARILQFKKRFFKWVLQADFTKNVDEALLLMSREKYDAVFVDHDLSEEHYEGVLTKNKTGYDFAKEVVVAPENTFIVHSLNPVGAKNIQEALLEKTKNVVVLPFAWMEPKFAALERFFLSKMVVGGSST